MEKPEETRPARKKADPFYQGAVRIKAGERFQRMVDDGSGSKGTDAPENGAVFSTREGSFFVPRSELLKLCEE